MIKILLLLSIGFLCGYAYEEPVHECTGQPVAVEVHDGYTVCVYTVKKHRIGRIVRVRY